MGTGRTPTIRFEVGNDDEGFATPDVMELTIEADMEATSSTCTAQLRRAPDGLNFLQTVKVALGYNGYALACFTGQVEQRGRKVWPSEPRIVASDQLRLTQYPTLTPDQIALLTPGQVAVRREYGPAASTAAGRALTTDTAIIGDLLTTVAGVRGSLDLQGDPSYTFGRFQPVRLDPGSAPVTLIRDLDDITGFWTFGGPDGRAQRRSRPVVPAATPTWTYEQGVNIFNADRPQSISPIRNAAVVIGRPRSDNDDTVLLTRAVAANADPYGYVWDPPGYLPDEFRSDLIEDQATAQKVADRRLADLNRLPDQITLEVPGNPFLWPGMTVAVKSPELGLYAYTPYLIKKLQHYARTDRFDSTLTLLGYPGGATYAAPGAPIAAATTSTADDGAGGLVITADASASSDPGGDPTLLSYAWDANLQTGKSQAGALFTVTLTAADIAAGTSAVLVLAVRTADGRTAGATYTVSG